MSTWLQGFVSNWLASEQVIQLHELSEQRREQTGYGERQFEWDDPILVSEFNKIKDAFFASYPDLVREEGVLKKHFPEKDAALDTIDRLADEGKLSALEFLVLFREILTPKKTDHAA